MPPKKSSKQQPQDPAIRKMNFFKELDRLNPPTFDGGPDPIVSEKWLRVMAGRFDTLGVPEEYRVSFAIYYLRMDAEVWWNSVEPYHDIAHMDWENFKLLFRKEYFNNAQQVKVVSDYLDLKQGNMTVLEYYTRFRELALCIEGMDPARFLIVKFQTALNPTIRSKIVALEFDSLRQVLDAALRVEAFLANKRKITKKNNSPGPVRRRGGSSCGRYVPYACYSCGQQGHMRKDCPMSQENTPPWPATSDQISDTTGSSSGVDEGFSGEEYPTGPMQQTISHPRPSGHQSVYHHRYRSNNPNLRKTFRYQ